MATTVSASVLIVAINSNLLHFHSTVQFVEHFYAYLVWCSQVLCEIGSEVII